MVRSMTGFGQAGRTAAGCRIQVDLKSVNHRYTESMVRLPREWLHLEDALKKLIQKEVKRGRVDAFVTVEREGESGQSVELDLNLVRGYMEAARRMQEKLGVSGVLTVRDLIGIPDVVRFRDDAAADRDILEKELLACAEDALLQLAVMRKAEGSHLQEDLKRRLEIMRKHHRDVKAISPRVAEEYREKLKLRLKELLDSVPLDENRLAMEAAVFADRSNIDEELTRLESHFAQFDKLLLSEEPSGRKLDFLIQEMNREVNTIGSKANHSELSGSVVEMKAELEKIREQVQNIE